MCPSGVSQFKGSFQFGPLIQWTTVRLVVSENDWRRRDSEMEPQGRGSISPLRARRRNQIPRDLRVPPPNGSPEIADILASARYFRLLKIPPRSPMSLLRFRFGRSRNSGENFSQRIFLKVGGQSDARRSPRSSQRIAPPLNGPFRPPPKFLIFKICPGISHVKRISRQTEAPTPGENLILSMRWLDVDTRETNSMAARFSVGQEAI